MKALEIIVILWFCIVCFYTGYCISEYKHVERHKEIINQHNKSVYGYDRFDLHYITYGEKI